MKEAGGGRAWRSVALVAGVAAVGGLLFGYDTGVISSAILYLRSEFRLSPTTEGPVLEMTTERFAPVPGAAGLPKLVLVAGDGARAELYLHGAHVTSWIPAGDAADRLFLSARSHFRAGEAIRGGVPVCFPQFAAQGPLPNHGFARVSTWALVRAGRTDAGAAQAVLGLADSPATRAQWPHPFALELTVVWNPGPQRGATLGDLEPDGHLRMLCVEAAASRAPVGVAPGARWLGSQTLVATAA